jgi:hypothetical protein
MRARALLAALALLASPAAGQDIAAALYADPTDRYPHGVLGDTIEHATLVVRLTDGRRLSATLPAPLVFEDTAPRLADLDLDGAPEVIAVEAHEERGARLAVWGLRAGHLEQLAASPFIGIRFRWLAPAGAGDLDGDGAAEIAWVDRPHLEKTLRVWRYLPDPPRLEPVAALPGVTNHRIGETDIAGGLRDCGAGPEIVVADADWRRLLAVRLEGGRLTARDIGPHAGRASFSAALTCAGH